MTNIVYLVNRKCGDLSEVLGVCSAASWITHKHEMKILLQDAGTLNT